MANKTATLLLLIIWGYAKSLVAEQRGVEIGSYATVAGLVEKVFVDTEGIAHKILKGGVVVDTDAGNGRCHIVINEARATYSEQVTYAVDCASLIPTTMLCPDVRNYTFNCAQSDTVCTSTSLYWNGFVAIDGPVTGFPGSQVANDFAENKYAEMLKLAENAGLDPRSLDFHFSDAASRGPGRWEMQVRPEDLIVQQELAPIDSTGLSEMQTNSRPLHWLTSMWNQVEAEVILPAFEGVVALDRTHTTNDHGSSEGAVSPPIFKAVFDGVLISTPGADTQHWHRDSGLNTPHINHYTVYIPTVDVTEQMGPTEFLPGTNRDLSFYFTDWTSMFDYCGSTERPLVTAGSILIWDYRTIHRGTRNVDYPPTTLSAVNGNETAPADKEEVNKTHTSYNRPMLYRTYHLEGSWEDINMGDVSFYDTVRQKVP